MKSDAWGKSRGGWAGSFRGRKYPMPDGTVRLIATAADLDAVETAWAERHAREPFDWTTGAADPPRAPREPEPMDPERKHKHAEAVAYVTAYTGTWGLPLDIRARPDWGTKYLRLSERQVDALLAGRDRDAARNAAVIDADEWQADEYSAWLVRGALTSEARIAPAVGEGWYVIGETPWKVQRAVNGSGNLYAKRLDGTGWTYVPGGLKVIAAEGSPMTREQAQAYGRLYGVCAVCGRTLTDERSIADGIGPVCSGRLA